MESMNKICTDLPVMYKSTYPKIKAILWLPNTTWENELALKRDDHWLMDVWKWDFENKKERLEQVIDKVDPNIEWVKEIIADCTQYLRLMMRYDIPVVQIDPEKIKPHF